MAEAMQGNFSNEGEVVNLLERIFLIIRCATKKQKSERKKEE